MCDIVRPAVFLFVPFLVFGEVMGVAYGKTLEFTLSDWKGEPGIPEGWAGNKVSFAGDTYSDGMKFASSGSYLQSPQFGFALRSVKALVCCNSADAPKRLTFFAMSEGEKSGEGSPFDFSNQSGIYNWQTKEVECETDSFRIEIVGSDSRVNWYVLKLSVELDETRPIWHEVVPDSEVEPTMGLSNCWKVSEFKKTGGGKFARVADFSFAENVKSRSVWTNGESIDSFYAFSSEVAVSNIYPSTYKSSVNGLYAVLTNEDDLTICAIGLQATDRKQMELLLPIKLDAERKIKRLTVEFRGWEPKVGSAQSTTLQFHWCAVDSLEAIEFADWFYVQAGDYSGGDMDTQRSVQIPGQDLRNKKFIGLKWCVKNQANSSLLAISDLRVTAEVSQSGTVLSIR